ncbi:MFS transporter [Myxococcaceae bacterium GXIMD 01537]
MLKRFVDVRDQEVGAVLGSFLYFFTLMCGYSILKPLRDAMGTAGGVKELKWLFTATFAVMLVAVPVYSALVARWPRRRVVPLIYRFFLVNLLGFFVLMKLEVAPLYVARAFYVWVSVYNLFVVSVFWTFMADVFAAEQGKRLFGFIAAGGTVGMLVGPLLARTLAAPLGPVNLMLLTAVLLELSARCVRGLSGWAHDVQHQPPAAEGPVGGGMFAALKLVVSSPFLLAMTAQMLLYSLTSTFLYVQQVRLVDGVASGMAARTAAFASVDFWVHVLTLVLQVAVTGRLMSRVGVGVALAAVPVLTAVGFLALAAMPVMGLLIGFKALRGALHYALERPSRELLFTSVGREARYKAKSFIDTVVYRASDTVGGWLEGGLSALGLGMAGISLAAVPLAGLWCGVSLFLASKQRARPAEDAPVLAPANP